MKLTLCQWDGDDHTVSSSYPETISTNQKCCDSHKREAQLASTCELQPESAENNVRLNGLHVSENITDYKHQHRSHFAVKVKCEDASLSVSEEEILSKTSQHTLTQHLADVRLDVHILEVLMCVRVVEAQGRV